MTFGQAGFAQRIDFVWFGWITPAKRRPTNDLIPDADDVIFGANDLIPDADDLISRTKDPISRVDGLFFPYLTQGFFADRPGRHGTLADPDATALRGTVNESILALRRL